MQLVHIACEDSWGKRVLKTGFEPLCEDILKHLLLPFPQDIVKCVGCQCIPVEAIDGDPFEKRSSDKLNETGLLDVALGT